MESGKVISKEKLKSDLSAAGIKCGDSVLVHSSMSRVGFLENGPQTFIEALIETVGESGNILMPNSPNASFQEEYIQNLEIFDVLEDRSALGAITEAFRTYPGAVRSAHPTEPVSAYGPLKEYFTEGHFGELTPYTEKSPYFRLAETKGKILYVGVTLANAGTSLHLLEDHIGDSFPDPVYSSQIYNVKIRHADGSIKSMQTKVHNPAQSKLRKCDELIPHFIESGSMEEVKIGNADCLVTDSKKMLDTMIKLFEEKKVTMYKPNGYK